MRAFQDRRERQTRVVASRKQRTAENKLEVGDILSTCWGYDQTNREFYEVTEVNGAVRDDPEIAQAREEMGFMSGRCAPQQGQFIGEPMRKLVQWGDSVSICSFITARKWNTETVAGVKVGPALIGPATRDDAQSHPLLAPSAWSHPSRCSHFRSAYRRRAGANGRLDRGIRPR